MGKAASSRLSRVAQAACPGTVPAGNQNSTVEAVSRGAANPDARNPGAGYSRLYDRLHISSSEPAFSILATYMICPVCRLRWVTTPQI